MIASPQIFLAHAAKVKATGNKAVENARHTHNTSVIRVKME